jgi:integrase/recombinase XerC
MEQSVLDFLGYLGTVRNCSADTIRTYRHALAEALAGFRQLAGQGGLTLESLTATLLRKHLTQLSQRKISASTICVNTSVLRSWCKWLVRQGRLATNPAVGLRGPHIPKRLPRFLSYDDVTKLLSAPNRDSLLGSRDFAVLETIYTAGLRISELVGLDLDNLDLPEGLLKVRGKGRRERLGVLGPPAIAAVSAWLEWREKMAKTISVDPSAVFLTQYGKRLTVRAVTSIFRHYAEATRLDTHYTTHGLRHSFAQHMMTNGASLPSIKELLGHRSLNTTCIYTHVTQPQLRQVLNEKHPRA